MDRTHDNKVILIMGLQRSGTTALFKALSADPHVTAFHEHLDNPVFKNWNLRAAEEVNTVVNAVDGPVLMKPINDTMHRSIFDVIADFDTSHVHIVWIYRDPVEIYCSTIQFFSEPRKAEKGFYSSIEENARPEERFKEFIAMWKRRNTYALDVYRSRPDDITIVRYCDLIADPTVFRDLCRRVGLRGRYIFFPNKPRGHEHLPDAVLEKVTEETAETYATLNQSRTLVPQPGLLSSCLRLYWKVMNRLRR